MRIIFEPHRKQQDPYVTCIGFPVPGFPVHLVNSELENQVIQVPYIRYRGTTYDSGAYVKLKKQSGDEHAIVDVALQPHLLK